MALIENRVKTFSIIPDLLYSFKIIITRLFTGGLILVSILLWYLSSDSRVSKIIIDLSIGSLINPITLIFDSIVDDINYAKAFVIDIWNVIF